MDPIIHNRQGQIAVLFALIFPLFVLLLAFFVNMGLLINQKIRLQNAVDAGVYSATASMARDLSHAARLNLEIREIFKGDPGEVDYCSGWSESSNYDYITRKRSFNDKFWAENKYKEYQNVYHSCLDQIDRVNKQGIDNATRWGRIAALKTFYNGDGPSILRNPNQLEFESLLNSNQEKMFEYGQNDIPRSSCYLKVQESGRNPFDPYEGKDCDFEKFANLPITKTSKVQFAASLTAKVGFQNILPSRFHVGREHYDLRGEIKLATTAAGQPYDGSVTGLRDSYRATLIPMKKFDDERNELH